MNPPDPLDRFEQEYVLFEGEEDLTIRPYRGPLSQTGKKAEPQGAATFRSVELVVEGPEDLTIRPRMGLLRLARTPQHGGTSEELPSPTAPRDRRVRSR